VQQPMLRAVFQRRFFDPCGQSIFRAAYAVGQCLTRLPDISNDVFPVKFEMSKPIKRWLLYKYVGLEFTPLSKPFKTREQAEKAREKYPEYLRNTIGLGVIRIRK
jgi:hypothetical protein